jgi:hypothetical protein
MLLGIEVIRRQKAIADKRTLRLLVFARNQQAGDANQLKFSFFGKLLKYKKHFC